MNEQLARQLIDALVRREWRLAGAESCTGGLIATTLTEISGSSAAFDGALVAYANEAKRNILEVSAETLQTHGAVSEACALAMARGARRLFQVDLAYAITGIAGPEGGTSEKPVGTVWAALSGEQDMAVLWQLRGSRQSIRAESARRMLDWLLKTTVGAL